MEPGFVPPCRQTKRSFWVGYEPSGAPTDLWTFWHNTILHADWRNRGTPCRRGAMGEARITAKRHHRERFTRFKTLNAFYFYHIIGLPDILLGGLTRDGPLGFFHSYGRYRDFSRVLRLSDSIDVIVRAENPRPALRAVFGDRYSNKVLWPMLAVHDR